jgi:hypothetical protein
MPRDRYGFAAGDTAQQTRELPPGCKRTNGHGFPSKLLAHQFGRDGSLHQRTRMVSSPALAARLRAGIEISIK